MLATTPKREQSEFPFTSLLPGDDAAWIVLIQCFTKSFGFARQRVLLIDFTVWAIYYLPAILRFLH
ncbi:MAG: hypothetical protein DMG23_12110 [Acidobacteria bacterium]|nr:MAG: hypothetical protein DMG23_12110 [Acidobacteriota bacterium]